MNRGIGQLIASTLDSRGGETLDELALIRHAFTLERAERLASQDLPKLVWELTQGALLPKVNAAMGEGALANARSVIAEFREVLQRLLKNRKRAMKLWEEQWAHDVQRTALNPIGIRAGQTRYRLIADDLRAALSFVLLALFNETSNPNTGTCGFCKHNDCQMFFLKTRGEGGQRGPLPRAYCSPGHRSEHHDSGAARTERKHRTNEKRNRRYI